MPLIEARLGAIEVGGYGNAPRGVQRVSAVPLGAFWMVALRSARAGGPYVAAWQEECLLR